MLPPADPSPWLAVFGRCHPVLLHAPLGIVPAAALLEFGAALLRRDNPRGPVLALLWLGALSAAAAAASGFFLSHEPGYGGPELEWHLRTGFAVAGATWLAAILAFLRARLFVRLFLLLALGAMVPAGHLGGTLTHGAEFLFEPLHEAPPTTGPYFVTTIEPILQRHCTKCHNPRKAKGDLDLTTAAGIQKGGESGKVIAPGKPDTSDLITRCELPVGDDDVMPPAGKQPRPGKDDLATLRKWIADGAKFD